ncbi:MAG: hypothetical protein WA642_18095 [Steroidobacteraceae bacterium]
MIKSTVITMAATSLLALSGSVDATVTGTTTSIGTTGSPDCSGAAASAGVIWPPNHTMVSETIVGVTDPYPTDLPLAIVVTGIMQDESVAAIGSGNTSPDGTGIGTSTAQIRAERAGPGTGRIYFISFSATNMQGAQCTGTISVFVPHDQGQGFTPIDTGDRFDSTQTYF